MLDRLSLSVQAGELVRSSVRAAAASPRCSASSPAWIARRRANCGSERADHGPERRARLVFQDPNLFPWLTVRRQYPGGPGRARRACTRSAQEVDEFLRLVGLEAFADAYPHQLSGGMAQRVALARALINHPKVLLLDEPLGALDAFTRMRMQDEVLRLWQTRGTTMVLVTHDIDEAIYMSDRIVLLSARPAASTHDRGRPGAAALAHQSGVSAIADGDSGVAPFRGQCAVASNGSGSGTRRTDIPVRSSRPRRCRRTGMSVLRNSLVGFLPLALAASSSGCCVRTSVSRHITRKWIQFLSQGATLMADQVVANQEKILANQLKILANQASLEKLISNQATILANQQHILKNQSKLDTIIANQEKVLANQAKILAK